MGQRAEFQIQILERLGVPLLTAVGGVAVRTGVQPDLQGDAARLAELITRTVQMSLSLSNALDIRDDRGQADGLRLALAGLSAPLVAGAYEGTGRIPGEDDVARISGTLSAVLAFADNFTPAADATARLNNLDGNVIPFDGGTDEPQVHIQALFSLVPVVQAIGVYSFGRSEKKLVQDVSAILLERAAALSADLIGPGATLAQRKKAELSAVRALGLIYAQTHAMETSRLMMMAEQDRNAMVQANGGQVPMDSVWTSFDRSVEMLRLAAQAIAPQSDVSANRGGASGPAPVARTSPVSAASAPVAQNVEGLAQSASANPMSFFSAPKAADDEVEG